MSLHQYTSLLPSFKLSKRFSLLCGVNTLYLEERGLEGLDGLRELFKSSKAVEKSIAVIPFNPVEKSIAVLPFKNDSTNDSSAYFIDGIMEEILSDLSKVEDIKVLSRTSVEPYRNTTKSIAEIAKELNVVYILEGSGQKYGNNIRLRVQLIDAKNDKHLWSQSYEKQILKADDIIAIQTQIPQEITNEIKAQITP